MQHGRFVNDSKVHGNIRDVAESRRMGGLSGDNLIYYTQINLSGSIQTGYIGYQVANNYTGSAQIGMMGSDQFYDAMDLTQLEWNGTSNEAEPIGQIFTEIWNGSITQGFYNIANNGFPPLAPLIIPLNSTGGLNLTYWGTAITNLANPNAIFPNSLGLYQYNVIGNQLQIYNSTSGYYINGTYFSNGTLASSRVQCMVPNGGSGMVLLQRKLYIWWVHVNVKSVDFNIIYHTTL